MSIEHNNNNNKDKNTNNECNTPTSTTKYNKQIDVNNKAETNLLDFSG